MYLGIDSGSTTTKLLLVDDDGNVSGRRIAATGTDAREAAEQLWTDLSGELGRSASEPPPAVATGYGRRRIDLAPTVVTEITCHAVGVREHMPEARSVVDIGGQDSKAIRLDEAGQVADFAMNDKCAAGTGRFLGPARSAG